MVDRGGGWDGDGGQGGPIDVVGWMLSQPQGGCGMWMRCMVEVWSMIDARCGW